MSKEKPDPSYLYEFHGIELSEGKERVGACPLCDKDDHFYVSKAKGLFSCKRCGEEGNGYTFLRLFHQRLVDETSEDQYESLAENRGIRKEVLQKNRLALNFLTDEWVVPLTNHKKKFCNLYVWREIKGVRQLRSSPGCSHHLYLVDKLSESNPIWLVEGHWDALAMLDILEQIKKHNRYDVVALPGSTTFKREWCELLEGRDLRFIFDNDSAGEKGIAKVTKLVEDGTLQPSRIGIVRWQKQDSNDLRELLKG